jgi:methylase of polypeptide subunit release factors
MIYTNNALGSTLEQILSNAKVVKHDGTWELAELPQMKRPIYESFKKILAAIGGCWNGKTHLFWRDPTAPIQEMLAVGKTPKVNPYSLFETPDCAIDDLFLLLNLPTDDSLIPWRILEPSAGRGAIARRIRERLPNAIIDCYEIDPINRDVLEAQGFNVLGDDFLNAEAKGDYHFVVMNPPFERDSYTEHVQKAYSLLAPGGKLGAIAPHGMTFGSTRAIKDLRNLIAERGYCEDIGSPFETTKTRCVAFTIDHYSEDDLTRVWSKTNGYASWHVYHAMTHLDNEPRWHNAIEKRETSRERIGQLADDLISKYNKECYLLYWDAQVRNHCIDYFLEQIEPEKTQKELYQETQLSFFAPA